MWIAALTGWYSIVRKGGDGKEWQIRARVKRDLLNLMVAARLDGQEVIETPLADYRFRILANKEQLGRVFQALEGSLNYPNFKAAIGKTRGQEKHLQAYHKIWAIMAGLQPQQSTFGSRGSLWERDTTDEVEPPAPAVGHEKPNTKRGDPRRPSKN